MKVKVYFKPIEIDIDEQTYEEWLVQDATALREVGLETAEALGQRIPSISHIEEVKP